MRLVDGETDALMTCNVRDADNDVRVSEACSDQRLASTRRGQADIWTLDMDTRRVQLVIGDPVGDFRPTWSPDGQWIAFTSDRQRAASICPTTTEPNPGPLQCSS